VAMFVEDMVKDLGHEVVGPALTLAEALELVRTEVIDCAILDINLGHGIVSTPVALALTRQGVPFLFATGYGATGVTEAFGTAPVLSKPFMMRDLQEALQRAVSQDRDR
jgi:CheY-like chemotaxis protein